MTNGCTSASLLGLGNASRTEEQTRHIWEEHDHFTRKNLSNHHIYISFENGLQNLLHVPEDWNIPGKEHQRIINAILQDDSYKISRDAYFQICDDEPGSVVSSLCRARAIFYNNTISLINQYCDSQHRKGGGRVLHFQEDHLNNVIQCTLSDFDSKTSRRFGPSKNWDSLVWPMFIHIEESGDSDLALDRGRDSPRAKKTGEEDPLSEYRTPPYQIFLGKSKRESAESTVDKIPNMSQTSTAPARSNGSPTSACIEHQKVAWARLYCVRYLWEILEISVLRSHAFLTLVDRDHLQLMYADRSAVVTTSIINLRTPEGEAMFLAMLIAFHRLTPKQWGLLPLVKNSFTVLSSGDTAYHREDGTITTKRECLRGVELQLQGEIKRHPVRLMLDDILYHQPGIIGRGTCVIAASCNDVKDWKGQELVVKVSWPSETRKSEIFLLNLARRKGEELVKERKVKQAELFKEVENLRESGKFEEATAKSHDAQSLVEEFDKHWALNHLPNILYSEDFQLGSENEPMPQTKLALFFSKAEYVNGEFKYETRVLRVSVQERLYKMTTLPSLVGYAQVFYDIFLCHRWLYDYPYILHRDISSGNIMYRTIDGKIYGVLNDLDLSSLRKSVEEGEQTSLQRTGTPPYMAVELLREGARHLYRHDLESLMYIILLLCCRSKFTPDNALEPLPSPKLNSWFDTKVTWFDLAGRKLIFWETIDTLETCIDPSFKEFLPCLDELADSFSGGFREKSAWKSAVRRYNTKARSGVGRGVADTDQGPPKFDDETLGGMVAFEAIVASMSSFRGKKLEDRSKDRLGSFEDHDAIEAFARLFTSQPHPSYLTFP
ncbi:hypothetical protein BDZ94DRAFT_1309434 [Collybia nuda]|uniref:Protein kinase domain-containing protein n=1 Tax=Collybia nuda TaxID=64659 RepID=A0A9P5Y7I1_9AGAR|nr:hypothetical protein BDZ94DRAFT_1309434 [Collybia nuda]